MSKQVTIIPNSGLWKREDFYVRSENGHEWMMVNVATQGSMIDLKINSSYAPMCYLWTHCGEDVDWREWFQDTDFSYFMGKMFGTKARCFSPRKTYEAIREAILECSATHEADKRIERLDWDSSDWGGKHDVLNWLQDHTDWVGYDDWWHLIRTEDRPDLVAFWETLWRPFILESKALPATSPAPDAG